MAEDFFSLIRASCKEVCENARHIRLVKDRLDDYVVSLPLDEAQKPVMDEVNHFVGTAEETIAFFLILDAINFGSGYFPLLKKKEGMTGYFTIASSLTEFVRKYGIPTAEELTKVDVDWCKEVFGQKDVVCAIDELMVLFAQAINQLGQFLNKDFEGSYIRLIEHADNSAAKLVSQLVKMPLFRDFGEYKDNRVYFLKRAQITVSDISIAFRNEGLGYFRDLSELTIFADNLVPHVLRKDGVLEYSPELLAKINKGELLDSWSEEEVEIRAFAVHTVELMKEALAAKGLKISAQGLDYLLWNRGQKTFYRKENRHCTRCVFY